MVYEDIMSNLYRLRRLVKDESLYLQIVSVLTSTSRYPITKRRSTLLYQQPWNDSLTIRSGQRQSELAERRRRDRRLYGGDLTRAGINSNTSSVKRKRSYYPFEVAVFRDMYVVVLQYN